MTESRGLMSARTVGNSTIFPVVGLSVTFSITLMTFGLLDLPSEIGWAALFMIPMVGFAMLLHRNQRGAIVNQRPVAAMVLIIVVAGTIVPRIVWEGTAIVGLAAISLVLGVTVGALMQSSYQTAGTISTAETTHS